jgi:putative ABC transport system substrate-binding protein
MRRREFITLFGGASVAWPLMARGQQPDRIRQVAVFVGLASSADDPIAREMIGPFSEAMQAAGWMDGKNVRLHYRFGGGDPTKIIESAAELATLAPDVIYVQGLPATRALHRTHTIPLVFTQIADPIGFGLVDSEAHPGGNVTGFVIWDRSIGGKWIRLLGEVAPKLTRVGVIYNPDTAPYVLPLIASAKAAAGSLAVAKLAAGDLDAQHESRLIVSEKVDAVFEVGISLLSGATATNVVNRFRKQVAANAMRLSAGARAARSH